MSEEEKVEIEQTQEKPSERETRLRRFGEMLEVSPDSEMAKRFYQATVALYRDPDFETADNSVQVIEEIALCGILPIKQHMSYWRIGKKIAWSPQARGLVFRASMDGIVKTIEDDVVYKPDEIRFPYELVEEMVKKAEELGDKARPILDMVNDITRRQGLNDPIIIRKPGDRKFDESNLVGSVCKIFRTDGTIRFDVMWATQLLNIRDGFSNKVVKTDKHGNATEEWSKAYKYTPWEMHKKAHIKAALKYELQCHEFQNTRTQRVIDQDNKENYSVEDTVLTLKPGPTFEDVYSKYGNT